MSKNENIIWVCGIYKGSHKGISAWTFEGVFSNEEKAIDACETGKHFIGPAIMDKVMPGEDTDIWPGCYYPNVEGNTTKTTV